MLSLLKSLLCTALQCARPSSRTYLTTYDVTIRLDDLDSHTGCGCVVMQIPSHAARASALHEFSVHFKRDSHLGSAGSLETRRCADAHVANAARRQPFSFFTPKWTESGWERRNLRVVGLACNSFKDGLTNCCLGTEQALYSLHSHSNRAPGWLPSGLFPLGCITRFPVDGVCIVPGAYVQGCRIWTNIWTPCYLCAHQDTDPDGQRKDNHILP